jgi:ankyrin repeat protein
MDFNAFYNVIISDDIAILSRYSSFSTHDPEWNMLATACRFGSYNCFEYLLSLDSIDVNNTFNHKTSLEILITEIIRDSGSQQIKCLKLLLAHKKLLINKTDPQGYTPFHLAISLKHLSNEENSLLVIQLLLAHPDLDINLPSDFGDTPLHTAIINYDSILPLLISHEKIDLNCFSPAYYRFTSYLENATPLHLAIQVNNTDAIELLIAQPTCRLNSLNSNLQTPLHMAAYYRVPKIIRYFCMTVPEIINFSPQFYNLYIAVYLCNMSFKLSLPVHLLLFIFSFWRVNGQFQTDFKDRTPIQFMFSNALKFQVNPCDTDECLAILNSCK